MDVNGDDANYGQMLVDYVEEKLTDFDCELTPDETDDALNKMNALSTLYCIRNEELIDGLVAFLKNSKRNMVTSSLLDEYESQVLKKRKNQTSTKPSSSATTLRNERQILKELSLSLFSKTSLEGNEDDAFQQNVMDPEVSLYDEPTHCKNIQNHLGFIVKSKFTGNSYLQEMDSENNAKFSIDLPQHKILSDCRQSSYRYGHSSIIYDIYEIMPWLNDQENDTNDLENLEDGANENDNNLLTLTGSIYPQEGIHLNFDNSSLFTTTDSYLLDFDKIERISLFPGMNLSIKCHLDSNGICQVQSVKEPPPLPLPELNHLSPYSRLKILIASGPFFDDTIDMEKFNKMLVAAKNVGANALILIGPFVPNNLNNLDEDAENIFLNFYVNLTSLLKNANIRVYLVPNCQTDSMAMPYFPTPPLIIPQLPNEHSSIKNNFITLLPDPAQFEFEGVRFAISSTEIMTHLCKREIYKSTNMENEDRMHRLISNLFSNRSLYPLFPSDPNLSFSLQNSHSKVRLDAKPHVLILPSILQPITKEVDGSLFINPGRYSRGKGSGTFALLEIDLHSALSSSISDAGTSISQFSEVSLLVS